MFIDHSHILIIPCQVPDSRYASIFKLAVLVLIGIFLMYIVREPPKNLSQVPSSRLAVCVAVSFATGAGGATARVGRETLV